MFSKKLMSRKMFQEGGMVTPSMPLPPSGGIVDGLGLNTPEAMPPIPMQDQEMITEGMADMAGKLGQVDAAEDTASLINAIRSDNLTLDDRYTELAKYVGRADATKTPESVLTLVQPTFELMEQGGNMGMLGSDSLQGTGPMEESMSATLTESPMGDTATMTETMEAPTLFNQGGLAVKKSKTPVYRANGSPYTGEMASFSDYPRNAGAFDMESNPYLSASNILIPTNSTTASPFSTQTEQMLSNQQLIEQQQQEMSPRQQAAGKSLPSQSLYLQNVLAGNPYTYANVSETMNRGVLGPDSATDILTERQGIIDSQDLLLPEDPSVAQARMMALLEPTMTEAKTPEELLKEREDFIGTMDNKPEAYFALAQSFNEMAQKPGTFLQSVAAGSGKAAELLAPLAREQEILNMQNKEKAFDRSVELAERLQGEQRGIALSALTESQSNINANNAFKQATVASSIEEAALQSRNAQEREMNIRETSLRLGLDWSNAQIKSVSDLYKDFGVPKYDNIGREFKTIFDPVTGEQSELWTGFRGEDGGFYNSLPNRIKATDPTFIPPEGAIIDENGQIDLSNTRPVANAGNMAEADVARIKQRMYERQKSVNDLEGILSDAVPQSGTGPEAVLKSLATHSLGTLGADWANYFNTEQKRARLKTWARTYIAANALSDRYAMGEQAILNEIINADAELFENPQAFATRLQTVMTGMLNDNEFDQALMEGRAPSRLDYLASGIKSDPLNYSKDSVRRLLAVAGEQGREGTWSVKLTPQDATVVDFAEFKPDGTLETYEEVMSAFNEGNRAGANKYQRFIDNDNLVFADVVLKRQANEKTSEPELQLYEFADLDKFYPGMPTMKASTYESLTKNIP